MTSPQMETLIILIDDLSLLIYLQTKHPFEGDINTSHYYFFFFASGKAQFTTYLDHLKVHHLSSTCFKSFFHYCSLTSLSEMPSSPPEFYWHIVSHLNFAYEWERFQEVRINELDFDHTFDEEPLVFCPYHGSGH